MLARPSIIESSPRPVPAEEVIVTLDMEQIRSLRRMRQHNQELNVNAVEFVPGRLRPVAEGVEGSAHVFSEWTTVGPKSSKKSVSKEDVIVSSPEDTVISFITGNPALGQAALRVGRARLTGPISKEIVERRPTACLALLGVPSRLIGSDLLQVLAPWRDSIRHIRVARHCEPPAWPSALALVLLRLESISAAERLFVAIQGRCYNEREPATCQLAFVDALAWSKLADDGLTQTEEKSSKITSLPPDSWYGPEALDDSPLWGRPRESSARAETTTTTTQNQTSLTVTDSHPEENQRQNSQHKDTCVVCLEKLFLIDEPGGGWSSSSSTTSHGAVSPTPGTTSIQLQLFTTACDHTFHTDCLSKWRNAPCPVCRYDHLGANSALATSCDDCGARDGLWLCLLCGHCGCEAHHALEHFEVTRHGYAMNTDSRHVWDFPGEGFVHRLALQRAAVGVPTSDNSLHIADHSKKTSNTTMRRIKSSLEEDDEKKSTLPNDDIDSSPNEYSLDLNRNSAIGIDSDDLSHTRTFLRPPAYPSFFLRGKSLDKEYVSTLAASREDEQHQRKLEGLAVEFNELLRSQLARQREIYEARIRQLRETPPTPEQQQRMNLLRRRRKQVDAKRAKVQAKLAAIQEELIFQDELNKTLEIDVVAADHAKIQAQKQLEKANENAKHLEAKFQQRVEELMLKLDDNIQSAAPSTESSSMERGSTTAEFTPSPLAHEESKHDEAPSSDSNELAHTSSNNNPDCFSADDLAPGEFRILYRRH